MSAAITSEGAVSEAPSFGGLPTLSLYVHLPFCRRKCPYCAFYSVVPGQGEIDAFLEGLRQEVRLWRRRSGPLPPLRSLYLGGGTPTLLDQEQWGRLISLLEETFSFRDAAEVTVEANPESLRPFHLARWRDWRVTRVSLGVQSLDDGELRLLGRLHDGREAREALGALADSGFSFSADLMFNLPGQTLRGWHRTLRDVLAFGMDHISVYELTLEEGASWAGSPPEGMGSGYPFYRWAQWYLASKGFSQYEIASFARHRRWSRHNLAYWIRSPLLAIGPGAWGFCRERRYGNVENLHAYLAHLKGERLPLAFQERLSPDRAFREGALLALRTAWGIPFRLFSRRYGNKALETVRGALDGLPDDLFVATDEGLALSSKGMRVANAVWERFL